jgi:hypothetical protein
MRVWTELRGYHHRSAISQLCTRPWDFPCAHSYYSYPNPNHEQGTVLQEADRRQA